MHVAHSRALAAAVVALSTCAGATHLALGRDRPAPRVALVAASAPAGDTAAVASARAAPPAGVE